MWQRQNDKMQEVTEKEALNKAAAYCSAAEHCISEVSGKLRTWGMNQHAEAVISRLIKEKFIDEERFCNSFVREKIRYNKWGKIKTAQALRVKDIDPSIIRNALDAFDDEEYTDILRQLLQAKAHTVKAPSEYEKNCKLIRFALSRGFEMPLVTKLLHAEDIME